MNIFTFFADKPERIMLVSLFFLLTFLVGFVGLYVKGKKCLRLWPAFIIAGIWFGWALWESHCQSMGYNIRVDLLIIIFLVVLMTASLIGYQIILMLPNKRKDKRDQQDK
ncbi:MAG: hypothetical protein ACYSOY_03180 [Planctomycetota bacterium]|jgi:hypothetical protein